MTISSKKSMMRILRWTLAAALFNLAGGSAVFAAPQNARPAKLDPVTLVKRSAQALGIENLEKFKSMEMEGLATFWEPGQSFEPGGPPEIETRGLFREFREFASGNVRTDWERIHYEDPWQRLSIYSDILVDGRGYVIGTDGTSRTKRQIDLKLTPPQRWMSPTHMTSAFRESQRLAPDLILQLMRQPEKLSAAPAIVVAGRSYPTVRFAGPHGTLYVAFDPRSYLPVRIRTLDFDMFEGNSHFDSVPSKWKAVNGVMLPHLHTYELNQKRISTFEIRSVKTDLPVDDARFKVDQSLIASVPAPAAVSDTYFQWILRRQYIGSYLDNDPLSHDPAQTKMRFEDIAKGVSHVVGSVHNAMMVEMRDYLILFDAPYTDTHSRWILEEAARKYPGKPVRYLVLTHHHFDHMAGFREFTSRGATLVVGKGFRNFWTRALTANDSLGVDTPKKRYKPKLMEVSDRTRITDGARTVEIYTIPNPHSAGTVMGFVPDVKTGYVTDLWTPGRDAISVAANPYQAAVFNLVNRWKLDVDQFAGGHGFAAPFAPLRLTAE